MNLTDPEKLFLRDLSMNPNFAAICRKIQGTCPPLNYRKKGDEAVKVQHWTFDSGYHKGVAFCLSVFGYKDE